MAGINDFFRKASSNKTYVIAEVSQNHDGSLGQAHAFIDAVALTGADAIKFQTHIASQESTRDEPFRVKFSYEDATRYDYWKRMEFTEEQWKGLFNHASEKGLDFLSSAFSVKAFELLDRIGCPAWKLGAGEVFNGYLMEKMIATGKPMLLSTGMSTYADMEEHVKKVKEHGNDLTLFQCTTAYPCPPERIGLNNITEMKDRFGCHVGISDHSGTIYPSLAAVTLGASMVEVHVTLSEYMFGPDVASSLTIPKLREMVEGVRFIDTMKSNPVDKTALTEDLVYLKGMFAKGIYAARDMEAGTVLTEDDIVMKKPYKGIDAGRYSEVLGRRLLRTKGTDDPIEIDDIGII